MANIDDIDYQSFRVEMSYDLSTGRTEWTNCTADHPFIKLKIRRDVGPFTFDSFRMTHFSNDGCTIYLDARLEQQQCGSSSNKALSACGKLLDQWNRGLNIPGSYSRKEVEKIILDCQMDGLTIIKSE